MTDQEIMFERAEGDAYFKAKQDLTDAGPLLLDALERMLGDYESEHGENFCECDSSTGHTCSACVARRAIAKANGEA